MKVLAKEISQAVFEFTLPNWSISAGADWQQFQPGGNAFWSETYFDLAGLSMEDKTLFFNGVMQQEMLNPQFYNHAAGDGVYITDLLSSVPLRSTELEQFPIIGNFAYNPLDVKSLTFDQTIYCRLRQFVIPNTQGTYAAGTLVSDNQIGSLEPTASDRIYVYRIVYLGTPITADRVDVFPTRFVLYADAREEKEYQYLMRLKRSYELQQTFDND